MNTTLNTAVLIPCFNEEATIAKVVADFRATLPEAQIYVIVDGDATYDAAAAPRMIKLLVDNQLDMVNGARLTTIKEAYRPGHRFGNWLLTGIVAWTFGNRLKDMLSGYRVFSRRYVKSFPSLSAGFETETELTVHALHLRMPIAEIVTAYKDRPTESTSKLSTYKDGCRILLRILAFIKEERPMAFFSVIALFFALSSVGLMVPIMAEFIETGLVPRLPTAVLSMSMMIIGFLSFACGLILDTVSRGRSEMKRMRYLSTPAIAVPPGTSFQMFHDINEAIVKSARPATINHPPLTTPLGSH